MGCTTLSLREKDVVDINSGRILGFIEELEIDPECGRVTAIIVGRDKIFPITLKKKQIRIRWEKIVRIGCDTVLVEYKEDCSENGDGCKMSKKY